VALLVSEQAHYYQKLDVGVMGLERGQAEDFLRRLSRLTRHGKAFRGHVLSVEEDCHRQLSVRFHKLPPVRRDEIILPEAVLRRIERQALGFSRHAEKLRAAGRHLKRGILLHGAPGTGKTLSAMYLASQMPGRTVLLITGGEIGSIEVACRLARLLEPATIILEDVDLIGSERRGQTVNANALLFELLNQMDGLAEDSDILFLLTTNRPDILEPALAARPGRIDLALEVPLPDADCRQRLLDLYGRGLQLELTDPDKLVERTAGASGAFIRELLRKAAVFAAEENGTSPLVVRDRHIDEGLTELVVAGGPLTQSLLGARTEGPKCAATA
jgi:cell division protease FtsH